MNDISSRINMIISSGVWNVFDLLIVLMLK
jgi:hypothetical protein